MYITRYICVYVYLHQEEDILIYTFGCQNYQTCQWIGIIDRTNSSLSALICEYKRQIIMPIVGALKFQEKKSREKKNFEVNIENFQKSKPLKYSNQNICC